MTADRGIDPVAATPGADRGIERTRTGPTLRVLAAPEDVAEAAAAEIAGVLSAAIAERGVAHWSTTGGSAAPPIYRQLRVPPLRDVVAWEHVHVWWGDDRFVPTDHPLSNVLPLEQVLLDTGGDETGSGATSADVGAAGAGVRIPSANLHPVPVGAAIAHGSGAAWAAASYEATLLEAGPPANADGVPVFDLVVLGVGPDGHVLSVFPGSAVWDAAGLCAAVPAPTHIEPHVERVTMHPRILAAARRVLVVSTGAAKAAALERAWTGDDARELPLRAARAPNATWLLDEAAAARLPRG
jgi:6-phosphogluconolactonase